MDERSRGVGGEMSEGKSGRGEEWVRRREEREGDG